MRPETNISMQAPKGEGERKAFNTRKNSGLGRKKKERGLQVKK